VRPLDVAGRAQILIIAADGVFRGIRFQELTFSVVLHSDRDDAAFLVEAFNSRRLLAWSERVFFRTPYRFADVRVTDAGMALSVNGSAVFRAEQGAIRRPATVDDMWDGRIELRGGRRFFARLTGKGESTPFDETDLLVIDGTRTDILPHLTLSGFRAESWLIRRDAQHARSRTYRR
jgi:hypothetical protein